jgi:hypothetical protein
MIRLSADEGHRRTAFVKMRRAASAEPRLTWRRQVPNCPQNCSSSNPIEQVAGSMLSP